MVIPLRQNIWILIHLILRKLLCIYNVFHTLLHAGVSELKNMISDPSPGEESEKYMRNYYCNSMCYMLCVGNSEEWFQGRPTEEVI